MGLGLAISKKIIDLMEGKINVTSIEKSGSTFSINLKLPLAPKYEKNKKRLQKIIQEKL
jgi:signal transduction histidine kinase